MQCFTAFTNKAEVFFEKYILKGMDASPLGEVKRS
jgi:hypothetical protein